ncbi:MAG: ABC transporter ATP-binding protein [Eubacterium sp.]
MVVNDNIIEVDNLCTYFFDNNEVLKAVDGISFNVKKGSTVAIVGESGSGKSVTSLSLMKLIRESEGKIVKGSIRFDTGDEIVDIVKASTQKMRELRGNKLSMIFQEPMTSLNPVLKIETQLRESIILHNPLISKSEVKNRMLELLSMVKIPNEEHILKCYPHELSGGMRQRIMIAMAVSCNPSLIIADEPTTALDVTIQAQILQLLAELKQKNNLSMILITHDLGVVAQMADYVVVMYAGKIIEQGTAREIFEKPAHPYTKGLMRSHPKISDDSDRLYSIPGNVPNLINMPKHCYFKDRCEECTDKCSGRYPNEIQLTGTHKVSCHKHLHGEN